MAMNSNPSGSRAGSVEITIDRDGHVTFTVKGVKGRSCVELTKPLEDALGKQVLRDYTGDFYEVSETALATLRPGVQRDSRGK